MKFESGDLHELATSAAVKVRIPSKVEARSIETRRRGRACRENMQREYQQNALNKRARTIEQMAGFLWRLADMRYPNAPDVTISWSRAPMDLRIKWLALAAELFDGCWPK